jgi:hypothetical protein
MELVVFSLIVLMPMSMLLMNACLMPLNCLSPYIPLNNCVFVTRRYGHVLQSLMPWTFRLSTARHTLHFIRHKSTSTLCPAFFYTGPTQTFSLGAKNMLNSATFSSPTTPSRPLIWFFFPGEAICSYMFTIVIENSLEPLYCTEKLNNSLLCGTVPIYR